LPLPSADEILIGTDSFAIPIKIDPSRKQEIHKVQLWVSSDRGKTWSLAESGNADTTQFRYKPPADGAYWFKLTLVDSKYLERQLKGITLQQAEKDFKTADFYGNQAPPTLSDEGGPSLKIIVRRPPNVEQKPAEPLRQELQELRDRFQKLEKELDNRERKDKLH
jgi:hypothetical protein